MYCAICGTPNVEQARFCIHCGTALGGQAVVVPPALPATQATSAPAAPAVLSTAAATTAMMPQTSGKAVASLVMALVNMMFAFLFFPLAALAVIFGHIARTDIRNSQGRLKGDGLALAGLIIGYGSLALVVGLVVLAIAIPAFSGYTRSSRSVADDTRALNAVRNLTVAAVTYEAQFAKGYPPSLAAMGPGGGQMDESAAGLIDRELASGDQYGYHFTYTPLDLNNDGVFEAFTLNADPTGFGSSSSRHFFVDQTGVIRYDNDHLATSDSPQLY